MTTRLLLLTFAIVMAGYLLESTLHIRNDYVHRAEALNVRANLLADLNAKVLAGPLWNFDRDLMSSTLSSLMSVPNVLGARITHPNGDVIISLGNFGTAGDGKTTAHQKIEWTNNGQTRLIGYFDIALDVSQVNDALVYGIMTTVSILVLLTGVVMASIYFAVRHITQPLDALNGLMYRIAEGRHDLAVPYLQRNDEIGRVAAAVKTFRDNAVELEKLRNNLEQQVSEQTKDLRYAKEEAEIANRAKSEFLSSMSHELRTPLNAIMGFAQLLELNAERYADNPQYAKSVKQILLSSTKLLGLIEQVLDFSKIETGNLEVTLEDVSMNSIIQAVQETVQPLASKYEINLSRTKGPFWDGLVHVDPILLRQAICNLMLNAIKYNRPGGRVEYTCTRMATGRVRFVITDTGVGIAPEKQADLFQPFTRLGAESSTIEGTGIGLSITKKLLDIMDCRIDFESVVGIGTTFWIEIPISRDLRTNDQAKAPAPDTGSEAGAPVGHVHNAEVEPVAVVADTIRPTNKASGHCVLYVEDSAANAALMEQYFSIIKSGPELIIAGTGEEGLELARERHPGLILMDINLPGISGLEAMQQLRAQSEFSRTPIVAVSADAMPDEIQKAKAAGFDDYLTKPIKLSLLKEIIERNLGEFEA